MRPRDEQSASVEVLRPYPAYLVHLQVTQVGPVERLYILRDGIGADQIPESAEGNHNVRTAAHRAG